MCQKTATQLSCTFACANVASRLSEIIKRLRRFILFKLLLLLPLLFLAACVTDSPTQISVTPRTRGLPVSHEPQYDEYTRETPAPIPVPVLYKATANPAMFETLDGIYLGAWLGRHLPKRDFVQSVGKNHAVFVYEFHLGSDFPTTWVLQNMALMATPLFVVQPPLEMCEETTIGELISEFASRLGDFHLPAFVAFYPAGGGLIPAEFSLLFRYARALFLEHAPHTAFVWVATDTTATRRNPFFPGHDAVDWVGVPLFARRDEDGFARDAAHDFTHFYHQFQAHHPIMVLPLGVSHISQVDYVYDIEAAADEISRLYRALANFPRVGLVVYADAFGMRTGGGNDDFAISIEQELLTAYRTAITESDIFVNLLVRNEEARQMWARHNLTGFYYSGAFIDTEILNQLGLNIPRVTIEFNDVTLADIGRVPGLEFCQTRQAILVP